jgi:uncharacterized protein YbaR (Trm112 family)
MRRWILSILCCPACKGDLEMQVGEENTEEILEGALRCSRCRVDYPIHEGIPDLLRRGTGPE